jgi:hypothetical protein
MLDLVFWSGSLALTPWALALSWKPISGVAGLIGPAAPAEPVRLLGPRRVAGLGRLFVTRDRAESLIRFIEHLFAMAAPSAPSRVDVIPDRSCAT